jgi:TPR repeat protein
MAEAPADAAPRRKRTADAAELASPREEQTQQNQIAEEFICPISHELPIKPVIAEDGRIYEEKDIRQWFGTKREAKSPSTGAVIGTKLIPAPQIRNTIENLVKSGAIVGELAEAWKEACTKKLEDEKEVKETRAMAEGGDGEAMYQLGNWYGCGRKGLVKDYAQARAWLERSAAARDPQGMEMFSSYLLNGIGGPQDNIFGIMNLTQAAELGSKMGAYSLVDAFRQGLHGLPKDPARARYWLNRAEDAERRRQELVKETLVKDTRARAQGGDANAMYLLGAWYEHGRHGLAKDDAQARAWYERSATAAEEDGESLDDEEIARRDAERAARNDALYARLQRRHEEHQRRQREATAPRE